MLTTIRRLALLLLVFLVWTPAAYAWSWPVQGPVVQPFSYDESHPYAPGQHRGVDIGADAGETVVAPAAGTVSFAGTVPTNGKTVTIEIARASPRRALSGGRSPSRRLPGLSGWAPGTKSGQARTSRRRVASRPVRCRRSSATWLRRCSPSVRCSPRDGHARTRTRP